MVAVITFNILSLPPDLRDAVSEHWYDIDRNLVTIRLSEQFEGGSDTEAHHAARLFHEICKQGYTLKVLPHHIGGWIPSRINPMTVEWTKQLTSDIDSVNDERYATD